MSPLELVFVAALLQKCNVRLAGFPQVCPVFSSLASFTLPPIPFPRVVHLCLQHLLTEGRANKALELSFLYTATENTAERAGTPVEPQRRFI